jgi:hypothetical protein
MIVSIERFQDRQGRVATDHRRFRELVAERQRGNTLAAGTTSSIRKVTITGL